MLEIRKTVNKYELVKDGHSIIASWDKDNANLAHSTHIDIFNALRNQESVKVVLVSTRELASLLDIEQMFNDVKEMMR